MNSNILDVKNLVVKYGEHTVLDDINFIISSHSFVSIVGPNGAGKSTLIKVLLGLTEYSSGNVLLFGKKPSRVDSSLISYVPQIKTMDRNFPAIAIELVLSGVKQRWPWTLHGEARSKAENALKLVGAKQIANRSIAELSGGELQRVAVARAVAAKPKIILADEPTANLDSKNSTALMDMMRSLNEKEGVTILFASHDEYVIESVRRIIRLNDGAIVES